jgi:molecular chaperone GrpE
MNEDELPREEAITAAEGTMSAEDLSKRLSAVEEQLGEFHRRAAHRETIIDRLHEENQRLKQGEHRVVLEPVVADLIRLHDQLSREARRAGSGDGLVSSFAEEVAEILDRCGIEVFAAEPGEPYLSDRHRPLAVVPTADPGLHNTVAEAAAAGFYDRETSRVRRPAQARFYQYHTDGGN